MKKGTVIVYMRYGQDYEYIKCKDLKEGQKILNGIKENKKFDYLELGIDKIDVDGTYPIIRAIRGDD